MPEDVDIQSAIDELMAISEQKASIIKEFNLKYKEIDADVKDLLAKKAEIEKQVLVLVNEKESLPGMINKATKEAKGIISAARAEAEEVKADAFLKAGQIIEATNAKEAELKDLADLLNERESRANLAVVEANSLLSSAKDTRLKAEKVLADANKQADKAIKDSAEANRLIALADVKKQAAELAEQALDAVRHEVEMQQIENAATKGFLNDQKTAFEKEKFDFMAMVESRKKAIDEKEAEIALIKENLEAQSAENSFKNAELDAGFMKLKREQEDVKKQKMIIDNMKKELSK